MTHRAGRLPWHTWLGLAILVAAETGVVGGNRTIATWLTPIAWTGYILTVDGIVRRVAGASWLTTRRREAPFLFVASIGIWLIFEAYNFHLRNWAYRGVPPGPLVRDIAYAWSFSTIAPAVFETADLVGSLFRRRLPPHPPDEAPRSRSPAVRAASTPSGPTPFGRQPAGRTAGGTLVRDGGPAWILLGLLLLTAPLILPTRAASYLFGAVWIGFILLVDPINARRGASSLAIRWKAGDRSPIFSLLLAGGICGILWETWNYQALRAGGAHWIYLIPDALRIFNLHYGQMPVLGLLGFPPFALELFCLYTLARTALGIDRFTTTRPV
jgi:hypothetical protein